MWITHTTGGLVGMHFKKGTAVLVSPALARLLAAELLDHADAAEAKAMPADSRPRLRRYHYEPSLN